MSPRDSLRDVDRLRHMIDFSNDIRGLVDGREEGAMADRGLARQLYWLVTVIGEAAHHLTTELRSRHPEIEWSAIIRTRNRVIHGYVDLNDDIIWRIATHHVPETLPHIERILATEFPDPEDAS